MSLRTELQECTYQLCIRRHATAITLWLRAESNSYAQKRGQGAAIAHFDTESFAACSYRDADQQRDGQKGPRTKKNKCFQMNYWEGLRKVARSKRMDGVFYEEFN